MLARDKVALSMTLWTLVSLAATNIMAQQRSEAPPASGVNGVGLANTPWPTFRGNYAHTGVGVQTSAPPAQPWVYETLAPFMTTSPLLDADGTVYLVADTLVALDGNTGRRKWEFNAGTHIGNATLGPGDLIYFGALLKPETVAANKNANLAEATLFILNRKTGKLIRTVTGFQGASGVQSVGSDGTLYFITGWPTLYALDPASKQLRWQKPLYKHDSSSAWYMLGQTPVPGPDGTLYFGFMKFYALDPKTGRERWTLPVEDQGFTSAPAFGPDGTIYATSMSFHKKTERSDEKGSLLAINPQSGQIKWRFDTRRFIESSPAVGANGLVYFGGGDSYLYAVDSKTGQRAWRFKAGDEIVSSPAISPDGTVYFGCIDHKVYALNGATGEKKWEIETGARIFSSPAIGANGLVYIASQDGKLYALKQ